MAPSLRSAESGVVGETDSSFEPERVAPLPRPKAPLPTHILQPVGFPVCFYVLWGCNAYPEYRGIYRPSWAAFLSLIIGEPI